MKIATKTLVTICFIFGCSNNPPPETPEAEVHESNSEEPVGIPVSGPAPATETRSATESIAEARCAREQTCENIGADKKYSSSDDCLARIREDWREDLNAPECPGGVNESELNECLTAIRNEDCSSPFDTLSRLAECGDSQICVGD